MSDPLQSLAQQLGVEVVECGHPQMHGRCASSDDERTYHFISIDVLEMADGGRAVSIACPGINPQATADAVMEKVMGLVGAAALEPAHTVVGDFSMMRVPRAQLRALAESLSTFPKEQP